jgi:hypothetical protein
MPREPMVSVLPLRAALKRGALVTLANWPVVLVELTLESLYKLALVVPILGGGLMVAALVGGDVRDLLGEGLASAIDVVVAALANAPVALDSFVAALAIVAFGGAIVMFAIKSGTLAVLVAGERTAGDIQRGPLRMGSLTRAYAYRMETVLDAVRRFLGRTTVLTVGLSLAYAVVAGGYFFAISESFTLALRFTWAPAWPLLVLLATSASVVALAAANLAFDLLRVIIITDDCRVGAAIGRLRAFLVEDARQVLGIFGVVGGLLTVAFAVSMLATAALTFIGWVPLIGLAAVPLQMAAWLVRGLVFQYVGLTALSAYQMQYRRFGERDTRPLASSAWVQRA